MKEGETFKLLFSDDINIHLYKKEDKWVFELKEDICNVSKDTVDNTVNIFKEFGFNDVNISGNYLYVKMQSDTKEPLVNAIAGELLVNTSFSKMTIMEMFTLASLTALQMKPEKKFLKTLNNLRAGKIDLDKVPMPGISGELKGSSADGELIKITDSAIYVKCMSVVKNHELQHKICDKCQWHNHPDRAKGKMLHCKMYWR